MKGGEDAARKNVVDLQRKYVCALEAAFEDPDKNEEQKTQLQRILAQSKYALAQNVRLAGKYVSSQKLYAEAMEMFVQMKDSEGEANALEGLGLADYEIRRLDDAAANFQKVRER